MVKTLLVIFTLLFIAGCGRTNDLNPDIDTKSNGKLELVTVEKSHFVTGNYPDSGHYQTIIKTVNKPDIYARNDALENPQNYTLYENNKHKEESVIQIQKSNNEVESTVMLLLDLSGSIIDEGCNVEGSTCNQLIKAANDFVDNIINNGKFKIAIYYFNSKKDIMPLSRETEYPTGNIDILKNAINQLKDQAFIERYLKGYDNSTNLYGAVKESGEKVCEWIDCEDQESFEIGSVVIFTDGRDLADIVSKKDMLKSLKKNLQYYTIGIGNADNKTLIEISGKARHFEASEENIEDAFSQTYNYILYNSAFYRINYCPSTQEGKVKIKIMFYDRANNIKAYTKEETIHIDQINVRCDI